MSTTGPEPAEDWTAEPGEEASVLTPIAEPAPGGVTVAGHRETTRSALAKWLMALLTLVVIGVLALAGLQMAGTLSASVLSIPDLATTVLTPVVTLAGTALGFYFGAQTAGANGKPEDGRVPTPREKGWMRRTFQRVW